MNLPTLQHLIRSMTGGEAREFNKIVASKDVEKNYIKLFDYLRNTKNIEFELLEKQYGKHGLEAARKYLIKVLMKGLRDADSEFGLENKLIDLLKDAQILHRKGFIKECFDRLAKIKDIALKNEYYSYYLIAAKLELRFLSRIQFAGIDEFELIKKQSEIADILEHEIQFQRHSKLQEILLMRYWRKGVVNTLQEKVKLNDLLLEEYTILNNRNYRSFESQKTHLNFQSVYFLMVGEHAESLKIFYSLNTLFQNNKALWFDAPEYYIALLDGILFDLYAMERYDEMNFYILQLAEIHPTSEDLAQKTELLTLYYQLSVLNQTNQYSAGKLMAEQNKPLITNILSNPLSQLKAQLCLTVFIVYFNNREFKECSRLLNLVLNSWVSNQHGSYNQLRTLYLMVQYELKNYDYLPYQIRSFQRKLNAEKGHGEVEKVVINIINQLLTNPRLDSKTYQKFIAKIEELAESPQHQNFIQKLQLKKWINAQSEPKFISN